MKNQMIKRKLHVDKRLQVRLTAWLCALTTFALVAQALVFISSMTRFATEPPQDPSVAFDKALWSGVATMGYSLLVVLPLMFVISRVTTARVSGPIFAITRFLGEVQSGEAVDECRLRTEDELQDLCRLVNDVTVEKRAANASRGRAAA